MTQSLIIALQGIGFPPYVTAALGFAEYSETDLVPTAHRKERIIAKRMVTTPTVWGEATQRWKVSQPTIGRISIAAETPLTSARAKRRFNFSEPTVGSRAAPPSFRFSAQWTINAPVSGARAAVVSAHAVPKYRLIYPSCGVLTARANDMGQGFFAQYNPTVVKNPSDAELLAMLQLL